MNYLAHAHRFLITGNESANFIAGTAVPDWLNVVNRKVRCRARQAEPFVGHENARLADLARGIIQHHADDAWFHSTRAFTELSIDFSLQLRERLGDISDLRSGFLGHIMVELLMDRALAEREVGLLDRYYEMMQSVDAPFVADAVCELSGGRAESLAQWIPRFCEVQFLRDYLDDSLLAFRVNQVLARVRLDPLTGELVELLPAMFASVAGRLDELLPT